MVQEQGEEQRGKLSQEMTEIKSMMQSLIEKEDKGKGIKNPFKLSKKKLEKGFVGIFLLRNNGVIDTKVVKIDDMMVYLKDNKTYHLASGNYIWRYKDYPIIILPENDLQPLNLERLNRMMTEEKSPALPQKIIIQALKQAQLLSAGKKDMNNTIWYILGGIVAVYILATTLTGGKIF